MCKKLNLYTMGDLNMNMMKMFNLLNQHFYNGELPKVIITFEGGYKKGAYGWITVKKEWIQGKEEKYNINISSDYLDRDIYSIMGTLLHEMAHLYNLVHDIQDTSRAGTYHNKRFKKTAEEHGLTVTEEDKIGWGRTYCTDETKRFLDSNCTIGSIRVCKKKPVEKSGESKPKQSTRKYTCPQCGILVRATKEVRLICGECYSPDVEPIFLELVEE